MQIYGFLEQACWGRGKPLNMKEAHYLREQKTDDATAHIRHPIDRHSELHILYAWANR